MCFVNRLPLVVIEAKRPESTHRQVDGDRGHQPAPAQPAPDEIPQLFGYAQLLMAVSQTEGATAPPAPPPNSGPLAEEEFDAAHHAR